MKPNSDVQLEQLLLTHTAALQYPPALPRNLLSLTLLLLLIIARQVGRSSTLTLTFHKNNRTLRSVSRYRHLHVRPRKCTVRSGGWGSTLGALGDSRAVDAISCLRASCSNCWRYLASSAATALSAVDVLLQPLRPESVTLVEPLLLLHRHLLAVD